MGNVFQFGNYAITKDMFFGWSLQFNHDGMWHQLQDVDVSILEACAVQLYPAYVPEGFQQTVRAEL